MILRATLIFFLLTLACPGGFAQKANPLLADDIYAQKNWVDSVYNSLSLKEKIGQLFMIDVFSNASEAQLDKARKLIKEHKIGGLIFSKGGPGRQIKIQNEFQEISRLPLLVAMDAEWGLSMRLDSTFALPWNMSLGAIEDDKLIEQAGAAISRHSRRMGVHINFAPVVDINTNPLNPIIGNRSFGEDRENVTQKSLAFLRGMQKEGVMAVAKHFPGHGDTSQDSHKTLPTINFSEERIRTTELYPYSQLIAEDLPGVMVAHLNVPSLEPQNNIPSTLSRNIVSGVLKNDLGFSGLIFTDAMNMKGITAANLPPGEKELRAFLAGNDVLLMSHEIPEAIAKIEQEYLAGKVPPGRMEESVKKILFAKYKAGLHNYEPVKPAFIYEELNSVRDSLLLENLFENAITLLKNNKAVVPAKNLDKKKIAYVNFGDADGSPFLAQLRKYSKVDWVSATDLADLLQRLEAYDLVILGFHKPDINPWAGYRFSEREIEWLHEIGRKYNTILALFTRPYALMELAGARHFEGILVGYQNHKMAQEKLAQVIFGALEAKGKLPVSIGDDFPVGTGYTTRKIDRLAYGLPGNVGLNGNKLKKIDEIVEQAIAQKMTPGAQVLVARKGKVVFQKNYGYHTYDEEIAVSDTSVYDLASLTKILATLPLVMQQEEEGIISLDTKLGEMMPFFRNSNKANISLQDMLMHYARLKAWLPFYVSTLQPGTNRLSEEFYRTVPSTEFGSQVASNMFIRNDVDQLILESIRDSSLERQQGYKYSDLPFYILKYYLEAYYGNSLHNLTQERFYKALGANYTGFIPLTKFKPEQIVPTEEDKLWRRQRVHGFVHDQGAAMQGGIGGHAGLFSTANDVAKIMFMYMNLGSYGGDTFLNSETVNKFNTCYYCDANVRRGVGFDKPQLGRSGPTCGCVPLESFGHTGFTGTFAWADPVEEIVYVFLSNRTYPDSNNRKLISNDIRSKIQEVIYDAIDF